MGIKITKKFVALLIALTMVFSLVPTGLFAMGDSGESYPQLQEYETGQGPNAYVPPTEYYPQPPAYGYNDYNYPGYAGDYDYGYSDCDDAYDAEEANDADMEHDDKNDDEKDDEDDEEHDEEADDEEYDEKDDEETDNDMEEKDDDENDVYNKEETEPEVGGIVRVEPVMPAGGIVAFSTQHTVGDFAALELLMSSGLVQDGDTVMLTAAIEVPVGQTLNLGFGGNEVTFLVAGAFRHFVVHGTMTLADGVTLQGRGPTNHTVRTSVWDFNNTVAPSTDVWPVGGGVTVSNGGSLVINSGVIERSRAVTGGGVMVYNGSNFEMTAGEIRNNISEGRGGGVATATNSTVTMSGGVIKDNIGMTRGGGLDFSATHINVNAQNGGVTVVNNMAFGNGAGVLFDVLVSDVYVTGITIHENWAADRILNSHLAFSGHGVGIMITTNARLAGYRITISDSFVTSNAGPITSGLQHDGGLLTLSNVSFMDNQTWNGSRDIGLNNRGDGNEVTVINVTTNGTIYTVYHYSQDYTLLSFQFPNGTTFDLFNRVGPSFIPGPAAPTRIRDPRDPASYLIDERWTYDHVTGEISIPLRNGGRLTLTGDSAASDSVVVSCVDGLRFEDGNGNLIIDRPPGSDITTPGLSGQGSVGIELQNGSTATVPEGVIVSEGAPGHVHVELPQPNGNNIEVPSSSTVYHALPDDVLVVDNNNHTYSDRDDATYIREPQDQNFFVRIEPSTPGLYNPWQCTCCNDRNFIPNPNFPGTGQVPWLEVDRNNSYDPWQCTGCCNGYYIPNPNYPGAGQHPWIGPVTRDPDYAGLVTAPGGNEYIPNPNYPGAGQHPWLGPVVRDPDYAGMVQSPDGDEYIVNPNYPGAGEHPWLGPVVRDPNYPGLVEGPGGNEYIVNPNYPGDSNNPWIEVERPDNPREPWTCNGCCDGYFIPNPHYPDDSNHPWIEVERPTDPNEPWKCTGCCEGYFIPNPNYPDDSNDPWIGVQRPDEPGDPWKCTGCCDSYFVPNPNYPDDSYNPWIRLLWGDVNNDGIVDATDALLIDQWLMDEFLVSLGFERYYNADIFLQVANVSMTGTISALDSLRIRQYVFDRGLTLAGFPARYNVVLGPQ